MSFEKTAGAIICFNRPDYTKQVLDSLEKCEESKDIDWYIFQDGITNPITGNSYAVEKEVKAVENIVLNSNLPIKKFTQSETNISIPQQKYLAHQLFNEYDLTIFFEDDLVVSPYYIRLLLIMANQYPDKLGSLYRQRNRGNNLYRLEYYSGARLWGYYMSRDVYSKIEKEYTEYYNQIKKIDYNVRWQTPNIRKIFTYPTIMHDVTLTRVCRKVGARKLYPYISRATYIGKNGAIAYRSEKFWHKKGMHLQPSNIFYKEDKELKGFKL
ncbi:MAG: hypothetical protein BV457_08050 [Thermoplasmata archaeon M9B1D]|nr:MAG: hypothetical protein BV457_08050 [Thermoplasmata archaeon M9B1D]